MYQAWVKYFIYVISWITDNMQKDKYYFPLFFRFIVINSLNNLPKNIWSPTEEPRFKQDSKAEPWITPCYLTESWLAKILEEWKRINFSTLKLVSRSKEPEERSIVILCSIHSDFLGSKKNSLFHPYVAQFLSQTSMWQQW